ncbi:hypothetical protein [uncultured Nisaea sp.]|uniref:hypothetical protein n=1 Tax=uncultured Nisaea sp. TaxID=538215 RepID=UPI0030ECABCE
MQDKQVEPPIQSIRYAVSGIKVGLPRLPDYGLIGFPGCVVDFITLKKLAEHAEFSKSGLHWPQNGCAGLRRQRWLRGMLTLASAVPKLSPESRAAQPSQALAQIS